MSRFFVKPEQISGDKVVIVGEDAKHIGTVLRMRKDEKITVCDGQSIDYDCIIIEIYKDSVEAKILDKQVNKAEPIIKVKLYQALPKLDKMEFIIQKCVELGIDEIIPVVSKRTIVKIEEPKKGEKKLERWNKISEAAAKQSMRGKIPQVSEIISFAQALKQAQLLDGAIIPYENERQTTLKTFAQNFKGRTIGVFIGPEGGFEQEEVLMAQKIGIQAVTLGNRILRTETAGLATVSNIIYELGDE
jgi:16S rRNA (uracil1498-N3)-methyltransferase